MKLTFPHMGYSYVAFKMLINELGYEAVVPPEPSKRTMDLGVRYSPEFACIPFKVLMGTYLETIEMGAEMAISSGGVGPAGQVTTVSCTRRSLMNWGMILRC